MYRYLVLVVLVALLFAMAVDDNASADFDVTVSPGLPVGVSPGDVVDAINISTSEAIGELEIDLALYHTSVADLIITLTSPSGTTIRLHDQQSDLGTGLVLTYSTQGGAYVAPFDCGTFDLGTLPGAATGCLLNPSGPGSLLDFVGESSLGDWVITIQDTSAVGIGTGSLDFWRIKNTAPPGTTLRRGDANDDGTFDISDAIFSLSALFVLGSAQPTCMDAADTNDDSSFDISDAVFTLTALFVPGGEPVPLPGSESCGLDIGDSIGCTSFGSCP